MTAAYRGTPRRRAPATTPAHEPDAEDFTRLLARRDVEPELVARSVDDDVARLLARRGSAEPLPDPVDDPVSRLLARRRGEEE